MKKQSKNLAKETRQLLIGEMAEEAWAEVSAEITKLRERLNESLPSRIFQEKHSTGWLWWKKIYYTYWRYSEGSVIQVGTYGSKTIERLENK